MISHALQGAVGRGLPCTVFVPSLKAAIPVRQMQKDQLQAVHTTPPSHNGHRASARPPCCHREPQWRPNRVFWRGSHRSGIGVSFLFSIPLRRRTLRRSRAYRSFGGFAFKLAAFLASIRINPRGHHGRVGPRIIGDDETLPLRQLLGVQQLCCTYRFEAELTGRFTAGLFRRMFAKEFATDRYRRLIAGRWFDSLLPDKAVSKASHRRCRWIRCCAIAPCAAKLGWHSRGSPLRQLVDNALSDIAYGVNRADHLLLANNNVIEQAFKLRRNARIN